MKAAQGDNSPASRSACLSNEPGELFRIRRKLLRDRPATTETALGALPLLLKFHPGEQLVDGCAAHAENLGGSRLVASNPLQHSHHVAALQFLERKQSFVVWRLFARLDSNSIRQIAKIDELAVHQHAGVSDHV